jgi:ATP-dependent helicase/nuclease subunit B
MNSFLKTFAQDLWKRYPAELGDLCIVLPNRRGALFLKEYLAEEAGKNIFAPEIYSTEDFIYKLSGLQIIDNTEMLFELYGVYRASMQGEAESFEVFSKWAPTLIADFNEIDRYLIDARQLFINLGSIKEIENWSLNSDVLSDFQMNYIHFWESLGTYYQGLSTKMLEQHKAWQGLAYRHVADQINSLAQNQPWKKIFFAGFNALNAAEEKIFTYLLKTGRAELNWDADSYYLEDKVQEAGKFLRKYKSQFSEDESTFHWISDTLRKGEKQIHIIGAAKNIAQAKLSGMLLKKIQETNASLRSTALVLADENLLFPVLNSIPEEIAEINVTMGYPLKSTPMASLFQMLFQLHVNADKFNKGRKGEKRFYHQDFTALLRHPYIRQTFRDTDLIRMLIRYIADNNIIFIGYKQLERFCEEKFKEEWPHLQVLFVSWNSIADSFHCFHQGIALLRKTFKTKERGKENAVHTNVETELLFQFSLFVNRLEELCSKHGHVTELKTLQTLFSQLSNTSTIPFYGEPLLGLQVMGMLETRTLDFENIILLSANENILPSGKAQNSFIPFDLKKLFGMPMYSDKDAVFAYHFYRLLQRAKNVYLVYNTESDRFGDGEKSRYITQLVNELVKVNPGIQIRESLLELSFKGTEEEGIQVGKDTAVLTKLNQFAEKGLSPTLLNTFRKCSLKFYLHYVAGIREVEEVEEEIGADTMGSVIHDVLEQLYAPYIGQLLLVQDIRKMQEGLDEKVMDTFSTYFPKEVLGSGKNLLSYRISLKFIKTFLQTEEKLLVEGKSLSIAYLEKELSAAIKTGDQTILIKGKADRIDRLGKDLRIIDYKTGKANADELKVNDWGDLLINYKLDKSFQLLCYAWLYARETGATEELLSGIITFRELSAGLKTVKVPEKTDRLNGEMLHAFEETLKILIQNMFNPEMQFSQTTEVKNCEFCAFKVFCNR